MTQKNFGRKRLNLNSKEINELIVNQHNILQSICNKYDEKVTHIKPHGALNNMACEDFELASIIAKSIYEIDKDLIFLVPTGSKMVKAGKKQNLKVASEIFADRNYEENLKFHQFYRSFQKLSYAYHLMILHTL